jgi:hypothetical protein
MSATTPTTGTVTCHDGDDVNWHFLQPGDYKISIADHTQSGDMEKVSIAVEEPGEFGQKVRKVKPADVFPWPVTVKSKDAYLACFKKSSGPQSSEAQGWHGPCGGTNTSLPYWSDGGWKLTLSVEKV